MAKFEKSLIGLNFTICRKCGGKLAFKGAGLYICEECQEEFLDDFGKVRAFVEENGPKPAHDIAIATGVRLHDIQEFLKAGRLEIPENSEIFIKCNKCGCDIRYGRFCPECAAKLAGGIKQAFLAGEIGERPKKRGKMHSAGQEDSRF